MTNFQQFTCSNTQAHIAYHNLHALALIAPQVLTDETIQTARAFNNPKRQREWLAVRTLLYLIASQNVLILYDANRKPFVAQAFEWNTVSGGSALVSHLNFSHTAQKVALIAHSSKSVGIDIEHPHPRIEKIKHKFLSPIELASKHAADLEWLTIFWAAKEAAYKCWGKKEISFATQLLLQMPLPPMQNTHEGKLSLLLLTDEGDFALMVYYQKLDSTTFMAWTCCDFLLTQ